MAINKVVYGDRTVLDLTSITAEESDVLQGYTFHKNTGEQVTGNAGCRVDYPTIIIPGISYKMVTWTNGTDQEIADMLRFHYTGIINIYDYWAIGNTRSVKLTTGETVQMVLLNKGGKTFVTPVEGKTTCAFVVGQKNCLSTTMSMHNDTTDRPTWIDCIRRSWCNSTYRNYIPASIRGLFKQIKNANNYGGTTNDYFALATQYEISGSGCWEYYVNSLNRTKGYGTDGDEKYWTRTADSGTVNTNFYLMGYGNEYMTRTWGIAPFGAI